jgi:Arc/MetJ family transcription regulator
MTGSSPSWIGESGDGGARLLLARSDSPIACFVPAMATRQHPQWHHLMRFCMLPRMRTTLTLDDELLTEAQRLTGTKEKTVLVREALRALIERESARRLARLGGTQAELTAAPRRRSAAA